MEWKTETRKISDLIEFDRNPRRLTNKQAEDLEKSLKKFNLVEIPAINTDNMILAGHQRLRILAKFQGDREIEVRVPTETLTPEECEEYLVRSNRNTGEWDWDELANSFNVPDLLDWGFDEQELSVNTNDFLPIEEDQDKLDQMDKKVIDCPKCGEQIEI
jgi:hypothetical protein